jgi:hypothetical protein
MLTGGGGEAPRSGALDGILANPRTNHPQKRSCTVKKTAWIMGDKGSDLAKI